MRQRMRGLIATSIAVVAISAAACDGDAGSPTATTSTSSTGASTTAPSGTTSSSPDTSVGDGDVLSRSCVITDENLEIAVRYPRGWFRNDTTTTEGEEMPPCRVFHHETFELTRRNELIEFDVFADVDNVAFETVVTADSDQSEILSEERLTIDGRQALRRELRLLEDGIAGPTGARVTYIYADLPGQRVLILRTHEVGRLDYSRNTAVLDQMAEQLEISDTD